MFLLLNSRIDGGKVSSWESTRSRFPRFLFSCWALTTMETHQMKSTWAATRTQISGILQESCRIVQFQYAQKPMDFLKIKCLVKNPWECCEMSGANGGIGFSERSSNTLCGF